MAQTITFRLVTPDELPTVLAIYDRARKFMAAHGNPRQWNTTWPTRNLMSWPDKSALQNSPGAGIIAVIAQCPAPEK